MKPSRAAPEITVPTAAPSSGLGGAWTRFWFQPVDTLSLKITRTLAGLLFFFWLLPFANHYDSLFGLQGWFDAQAYVDLSSLPDDPQPPPPWSLVFLCGDNAASLALLYWGSLAAFLLFAAGLFPRLTGVLSWLAVVSFTANPALETDADVFLTLLAFYLMIAYLLVGQRRSELSLWERILGPWPTWLRRTGEEPRPSSGANVAVRLLQVHFALAVVVSALHKLQIGEWWWGVTFWYHLYPPFETTLSQAQKYAEHQQRFFEVLSAAAYAVLAWQLAFPLYAWRPRWRWLLLVGAVVGWLGSAFLYKLPLLGPAYFVCCLAFVTSAEWRSGFDWIRALLGRNTETAATDPQPRSAETASAARVGQRT